MTETVERVGIDINSMMEIPLAWQKALEYFKSLDEWQDTIAYKVVNK